MARWQVRGVCAGSDGALVTASRDKSLIVWAADDAGATGMSPRTTLVGHQHFVTCVAWVPAGALPAFPAGAVVSGSRDTRVLLWDVAASTIAAEMTGHEQQVLPLTAAPRCSVTPPQLFPNH